MRPVPGRGDGAAKAAGLRLRRGAKPPFSFRLRRKEKAPFDGVKRKDAGGGIPGFARNARSACYGGFGPAVAWALPPVSALDTNESPGRSRMPCCPLLLPHPGSCGRPEVWALPDAPPSSFAAAPRQFERACRRSFDTHRTASAKQKQGASGITPSTKLLRPPRCGSKREAGCIPEFPQLMKLHMWLSGPSHRPLPDQNPRKRRRERSGRSPECRRPSLFLLHHQKAHSLFPQEKENGGFEAAGLPRHPRPDGKRF